jgi:hypothetical protein
MALISGKAAMRYTLFMPSWIVDLPDRLDAFLAAEGRMLSRAKAQKAIEEKKAKVKIRVAASLFPFRFVAIQRQSKKDGGQWVYQEF